MYFLINGLILLFFKLVLIFTCSTKKTLLVFTNFLTQYCTRYLRSGFSILYLIQ